MTVSRPPRRELAQAYEPAHFEDGLYDFWQSQNCFSAASKSAPGQDPFCIVIPPPNVTGVLHMGHALTNTIQDILTRWHRMKGDNTLWLPGTDHAGIATQAQVEKAIRPRTRHDMGRKAFIERTWQWKEECHRGITGQLKKLGSSLDWSRERFTMDDGFSHAVREVFVRLYEESLMYRGERIINWCPRCQTALSDLETIPTDKNGSFYHLRYEVVNPGNGPKELVIATTRPETLLGDTAVAVHPDDERYTALHGKKVKLPLLGREIPVITDEYVDREFGSGALKITPGHDFNDFDIGSRHKLPIVTAIGKDGKITSAGGPYAGLVVSEARSRVVQELKTLGLLVKTEDHAHKVGCCQRCETVAEPLVSKQWFVKIEPLAKPAIEAVESGKITFTPKNWEKTYFEWMYNIRDWCVSRQLWWGHQIPAWYCGECQGITVARTDPTACSHCKADASKLKQDEDVLDTWFSSALWPFATMGWPEKTEDLKTFYPTSILETGFDIIFFWVARMIMMGLHFMGDVPFRKIYLHAMVRDEKGEKMSKSKGNVIDPLEIISKFGADPLRFTLAVMSGQGRDVKLSIDRVEGYRAFCNKLWNATRYFLMLVERLNADGIAIPEGVRNGGAAAWLSQNHSRLHVTNRWILSRLQTVTETVEAGLQNFEMNVSSQALYDFAWGELCDWFVEFSKLPNPDLGNSRRIETAITLHHAMETVMALLHPFIPFVTEELWQQLPWVKVSTSAENSAHTLMLQSFPKAHPAWKDAAAEEEIRQLQALIVALRAFRGENGLSPKTQFPVKTVTNNPGAARFLKAYGPEIMALARVSDLIVTPATAPKGEMETVIPLSHPEVELRISLEGLVDLAAESKRVEKEIERLRSDLNHIQRKLSNESFVAKAPPALVEKERGVATDLQNQLQQLEATLAQYKRK